MQTTAATPSEFVGLSEAARLLQINPITARKLLLNGTLTGRFVPGARPRITRASVEALVRSSTYGNPTSN
jgi:hypothetical protein